MKSLTADLEVAWIDCDCKDEDWLTFKKSLRFKLKSLKLPKTTYLGRVSIYRKECHEKEEELDAIHCMYSTTKKKLQHTEDRLRVSPLQVSHLKKALDTSFEVQCHTAAPVAWEDTSSDTTSGHITTIAASAKKAKASPLGNHFITTVRPEKPEREQEIRYVLLYPCALQSKMLSLY